MPNFVFLALFFFAAQGLFADDQHPPRIAVAHASKNEASDKKPSAAVDPIANVVLKVSIIEVSVAQLHRQGVDFEKMLADKSSASVPPKQKPADQDVELFGESPSAGSGCFLLRQDDQFFSTVKKLVKDKIAKVRAQPSLVAESGRAASFASGGEFPIPVTQSAGMTTTEWKKHGTIVDFVPLLLDQETIKLEIRTTLSELDESQHVSIGGTSIPGLTVTEMETAFTIKTNQIAVISGGPRSRVVQNSAASAGEKDESKPDSVADSSKETSEESVVLLLVKPEIVASAK